MTTTVDNGKPDRCCVSRRSIPFALSECQGGGGNWAIGGQEGSAFEDLGGHEVDGLGEGGQFARASSGDDHSPISGQVGIIAAVQMSIEKSVKR